MTGPIGGLFASLREQAKLPRWIVLVLFLATLFNVIIFFSLVSAFWRPETIPVPITGDVALALHLQLFEAFLAALAIGLAVLGFVGYSTLKEAAERRAEETARNVAQGYRQATDPPPSAPSESTPDLEGLDENVGPGDREPETGI